MEPSEVSLKEIRDYFGMTAQQMVREWKQLTDQDKLDIRTGLALQTYTY